MAAEAEGVMAESPEVAVSAASPVVVEVLAGLPGDLRDLVAVAAVNGVAHTVVSGAAAAVDVVVGVFEGRGVRVSRLVELLPYDRGSGCFLIGKCKLISLFLSPLGSKYSVIPERRIRSCVASSALDTQT